MNQVYEAARRYLDKGLCPIPLDGKKPLIPWKEFQRRLPDSSELWETFGEHPERNIGLVCGHISGRLLVLDWDVPEAYREWTTQHSHLATATVQTGGGGFHTYYRLVGDMDGLGNKAFTWKAKHVGEIRAEGGQAVAPPSIHPDTGETYTWLIDEPILEIDSWEALGLNTLQMATPEHQHEQGGRIPKGQRNSTLASLAGTMRNRGMTVLSVRAAIEAENVARCDPPLTDTEVEATIFRSLQTWEPGELFHVAKQGEVTISRHLTDLGNAKRLVAQHGDDLHYVYPWRCWLVWDGRLWAKDTTGEVERRAKETVATIYSEASSAGDDGDRIKIAKHATRSEAAYRMKAMIEQARSERGVPVAPESLDADPWLLNVMNGTLDLLTGKLLPHRREDLITKLAPIEYDPLANSQLWDGFLDRIMNGNTGLVDFLKRAVGYALTGSTREQTLFILHGTGANGKSTFIEAIRAMVGDDYAQQTPVEAVLASRYGNHPTDIARMRGKRFVSTSEVQHGRGLAEGLIKQLTGGDRVTARFMHKDSFEFSPEFKIFMATNRKPNIAGTDHAIWRRIRLIPFTVTIPEQEQDKDLPEKLKQELPAIFRWAVDGCQAWQREGLGDPTEVRAATETYRSEMDVLGPFIEDCCVLDENTRAGSGELYNAYKAWSEDNGEKPLGSRAFGNRLTERGLHRARDRSRRFYMGIGLKDSEL